MARYRRLRVSGGTVFFEVCLARLGSDLLVQEIDLLRWSVAATRRARPFEVVSWMVLPDRMLAIWRLPPGDCAYSVRWGAIKGRFTRGLGEAGRSPALRHGARIAKGEVGLWQKRFWEHQVRDAADLAMHMELCRLAPVRAGLVAVAEDWPYSTFRNDRTARRA